MAWVAAYEGAAYGVCIPTCTVAFMAFSASTYFSIATVLRTCETHARTPCVHPVSMHAAAYRTVYREEGSL